MQDEDRPDKQDGPERQGFLTTLLQGFIRDTVGMWVTVLIGCSVGAIICVYFGLPLILSLLGGVIVLAIFMAWNNL